MSFTFNRRSANFDVFKNLFDKGEEDKDPSGATLPVSFGVDEKDIIDRLIPTHEHKADEEPFPSIVDFLFDTDNSFLYPYLSDIHINRKPQDLQVQIWYDADDDRKVITVNNVSAHSIILQPRSGKREIGTLCMSLKLPHLTADQFLVVRNIQKTTRHVSIKAMQDDLFLPKGDEKEEEPKAPPTSKQAKKKSTKKAAKKSSKKKSAKKSSAKKTSKKKRKTKTAPAGD